jgi:outer membrane murein-binding lipoprotein Lpp
MYFRPELSHGSAETHPYRAVKFDNATGLTLEKGPITVYSDGTFVGEGFVERMESGTTSFLTFAIDGSVLLDSHGGSREEGLRLLSIADGVIVSEMQNIQSTTYEVKNRHGHPIKAYIRSPKRSGWTLLNRPKGTVDTPEALIIPLAVPRKGSAKVDVELAQRVTRKLTIDSANTLELFRMYMGGGKAPAHLKQVLSEVLTLKEKINELKQEEQRRRGTHQALSLDQDRVRANLNVLRKTPGNQELKNELTRKLAQLEAELGKLSGRLVELSEKIAELEARMKALFKGITLKAS